VLGSPAQPIKDFFRQIATLKKMAKEQCEIARWPKLARESRALQCHDTSHHQARNRAAMRLIEVRFADGRESKFFYWDDLPIATAAAGRS